MCGRYTLRTRLNRVAEQFEIFGPVPDLPPRYNIAPTQGVPVVLVGPGGQREIRLLRWGLVPHWAKDPAIGNKLINARGETVAQKPAFRDAFKYRRCLIPADGFYEWQQLPNGKKQPYHITNPDGQPFAFAGLWEHWQDAHGNELETCAIITTDADEVVGSVHVRMPAILLPEEYARWLDPAFRDSAALLAMLQPRPHSELTARPVSPRVNKPANDDPDCLLPPPAPQPPLLPGAPAG